ncbi:MAG: ASCH domain-containing protein [Candidatus Poribacteria bacterium]|nr:ASCH domain-containing protein [Candidatus Poribacteria bacterium]MDE0424540.1 ASCH domain-containing protein [Candidatus Poribacteria bacterium]
MVNALSIVSPSVQHIIAGKKVVEIRRWLPPKLPFLDLVLVENEVYLTEEGQEDPNGLARAVVDITGIHEWTREEAESQGMDWMPNYVCWELSNVRPIVPPIRCLARRKIYKIDINACLPINR